MKEIRRLRVQNAILETLALSLHRGIGQASGAVGTAAHTLDETEMETPSLHLTRAEMSGDGRSITVFFVRSEWMADPKRAQTDPEQDKENAKKDAAAMRWLEANKSALRRSIASSVSLQYVPELYFRKDRGIENTLRVEEILSSLAKGQAV